MYCIHQMISINVIYFRINKLIKNNGGEEDTEQTAINYGSSTT